MSSVDFTSESDEQRLGGRWAPIYTGLRDAIVSHKLAPGAKLPEDELATIYNVSRTLVRSALQALSHDRLVNLEPNRGAFVAQPSKQQAREVFEARALIEPYVASMAAANSTPERIRQLRHHLEQEHIATHAGQDSDAIMLSAKFHIGIAEMAEHAIFLDFIKELISRSSLIIALYWKRRDTTCESHAHEALVNAIEKKDAQKASDLMRSHLVDLLSGLDLATKPEAGELKLANILKPDL